MQEGVAFLLSSADEVLKSVFGIGVNGTMSMAMSCVTAVVISLCLLLLLSYGVMLAKDDVIVDCML